jgi:transcriptional regulator GlxA family with amidase domain
MAIKVQSRGQLRRNGSLEHITALPPRRIAIVAVAPVRMLDVLGPAEVFGDATRLHGGDPVYEVEILSAGEERIVATHIGIPLVANRTYQELRRPVDTLLVAGGEGSREGGIRLNF